MAYYESTILVFNFTLQTSGGVQARMFPVNGLFPSDPETDLSGTFAEISGFIGFAIVNQEMGLSGGQLLGMERARMFPSTGLFPTDPETDLSGTFAEISGFIGFCTIIGKLRLRLRHL